MTFHKLRELIRANGRADKPLLRAWIVTETAVMVDVVINSRVETSPPLSISPFPPEHPSPTTMSKYLSSFIDQAQNAVQSSPLANKIPLGHHRPASPGVQNANNTNSSSSTTYKSSTFAALNHQFRTLKEQYSDSTPYQRLITTSKGVIMDYDNVARDAKANSKELYTWGQTETDDLKDGGCISLRQLAKNLLTISPLDSHRSTCILPIRSGIARCFSRGEA